MYGTAGQIILKAFFDAPANAISTDALRTECNKCNSDQRKNDHVSKTADKRNPCNQLLEPSPNIGNQIGIYNLIPGAVSQNHDSHKSQHGDERGQALFQYSTGFLCGDQVFRERLDLDPTECIESNNNNATERNRQESPL